MLSLTIGPLAFPLPPLMLLAALLPALWIARRLAPAGAGDRAETSVWLAMLAALIAARAGHLVLNAGAYAAEPAAALDIRDGGWLAGAGLVAGLAGLAWRGRAWPAGRRALAGAALGGLLLWAALQAVLAPTARDGGAPVAPATELHALADGRAAPLPQVLDGRPAVVNLWASWCGPCRTEMPLLAEAQRLHPRVRFVFVNQGEPAAAVRAYLDREGLALQEVWLDPQSALGPAVGSRGLPTTLFYDAAGRRVDAHFGVLNGPSLQARLARLVAPEARP